MRRATSGNYNSNRATNNFYPRSPCGERPPSFRIRLTPFKISIHALLAESDLLLPTTLAPSSSYFYPRSPCGERQYFMLCMTQMMVFLSTLSLRRATSPYQRLLSAVLDFYPRSPCGERQDFKAILVCGGEFLSTLSLRRATIQEVVAFVQPYVISIHALLAESDSAVCAALGITYDISIHALLAESDPQRCNSPGRC